jgi:hypothetical protein
MSSSEVGDKNPIADSMLTRIYLHDWNGINVSADTLSLDTMNKAEVSLFLLTHLRCSHVGNGEKRQKARRKTDLLYSTALLTGSCIGIQWAWGKPRDSSWSGMFSHSRALIGYWFRAL